MIRVPPALEKMNVSLSCSQHMNNQPDKNLSFAELRKKLAKPAPFRKKLVDIYKQGR
ncbi:hypothetical protein GC56T2_3233 [Geobacillus sp. C56-T2]|nr:hypothetical protein GC56T2_3233 [Geobacillus sp. C56-T2]